MPVGTHARSPHVSRMGSWVNAAALDLRGTVSFTQQADRSAIPLPVTEWFHLGWKRRGFPGTDGAESTGSKMRDHRGGHDVFLDAAHAGDRFRLDP